MATTHGKDGAVYVGANVCGCVTEWNGTWDSRFVDTAYLGDSYMAQVGGIISMSGSVNVDTDASDTNGQIALQTAVTGQSVARLYLYVNDTPFYWEFNANLELVDTVNVGDVVRRVYNYRSNSTITPPS
jgi:hypothetical protein